MLCYVKSAVFNSLVEAFSQWVNVGQAALAYHQVPRILEHKQHLIP